MSSAEKIERDVRILRRAAVLLCRAAGRCEDVEEAAVTRTLERQVRALADRLEEK
jgi:hypothetical protein